MDSIARLARWISFQKFGEFEHVRFRPVHTVAEAMQVAKSDASFIHPVKDLDAFMAAWKAQL